MLIPFINRILFKWNFYFNGKLKKWKKLKFRKNEKTEYI